MNDGNYKEAIAALAELIEQDSITTIFRYNRAICYFSINMLKESLADYKVLARQLPEESEYVFQQGKVYLKMDSLNKAKVYITKAIVMDNEVGEYFSNRGMAYLKNHEYNLAISDFSKSMFLSGKDKTALHNRGIAYLKMGNREKACQDWCEATTLGNNNSKLHLEKNCRLTPCTK